MRNLAATAIGVVVVVLVGTFVTIQNPIVGIPFMLAGLFLLLCPNFLLKKLSSKSSSEKKESEEISPTVPRVESYTLADTQAHSAEIESLGTLNPDYELDKEGIIQAHIGGENIYRLNFSPRDVLLEESSSGEDIHVIVDEKCVGNIGKRNRERVRVLMHDGSVLSMKVLIFGGQYRILDPADGEIHSGQNDYSVKMDISISRQ